MRTALRRPGFIVMCALGLGVAAYSLLMNGSGKFGNGLHPEMRARFVANASAIRVHAFGGLAGKLGFGCLAVAWLQMRLYLPGAMVLRIPFEAAYPAIAWLCWIPNLLVAERILRGANASSRASLPARP
jgi:hypothetical protein